MIGVEYGYLHDVELNNDQMELILAPHDVELNNDQVEWTLVSKRCRIK